MVRKKEKREKRRHAPEAASEIRREVGIRAVVVVAVRTGGQGAEGLVDRLHEGEGLTGAINTHREALAPGLAHGLHKVAACEPPYKARNKADFIGHGYVWNTAGNSSTSRIRIARIACLWRYFLGGDHCGRKRILLNTNLPMADGTNIGQLGTGGEQGCGGC